MIKFLHILPLVLLVAACSRPVVTVNTVDDRPHLQFTNAKSAATLSMDGVIVGPAADYDGVHKTLVVNTGTHLIEVRDGNRVLYSSQVYFGGDATRTINLPD